LPGSHHRRSQCISALVTGGNSPFAFKDAMGGQNRNLRQDADTQAERPHQCMQLRLTGMGYEFQEQAHDNRRNSRAALLSQAG
jgi:hypothetical protein